MARRVGGIIEFKIDGEVYSAKGSWSYGLGKPTREAIVGADSIHGYKEMPIAPFIEGEITDTGDISLEALASTFESTITLSLANGKVIALRDAWSTNPDGMSGQTEDGNVKVRFEGISADEIR